MDQQSVKAGTLAWFVGLLTEVQQILVAFPFVSFMVVAAGGAFAAGAFAVEAGTTQNGLRSRMVRAMFSCSILAFLWTYFQWPIPLGLATAGIVAVYPQQMLEWARDILKALGEARAKGGK